MKKTHLIALLVIATATLTIALRDNPEAAKQTAVIAKDPATKAARERTLDNSTTAVELSPDTFKDFTTRPFEPSVSSDRYQWTAEDGRKPQVIRKLAHNALEEARMADENHAVHKRQLVYITQSLSDSIKEADSEGRPLESHSIPSLDGQELEVEVMMVDHAVSGVDGVVYGKLRGVPDSTVTIAYSDKSECFSVLSPSQDFFLQGEPREPGEIVVKSFDPGRMATGCGQHVRPFETGE